VCFDTSPLQVAGFSNTEEAAVGKMPPIVPFLLEVCKFGVPTIPAVGCV